MAKKADERVSILLAAMAVEEFGIEYYGRLAKCVPEPEGKALMKSLGRDEEKHRRRIEEELIKVLDGTNAHAAGPSKEILGIVPSGPFPFPEKDNCLRVEDEIKALEIGMEVERRSIEMYRDAAARVSDKKLRELLLTLQGVEEGHLKLLEENMHMLRNEGAWYGYSPILEG
jgi:rubrerythrin